MGLNCIFRNTIQRFGINIQSLNIRNKGRKQMTQSPIPPQSQSQPETQTQPRSEFQLTDPKNNYSTATISHDVEIISTYLYKEICSRIENRDKNALSVLIAAQKRLKHDLENCKDTIKWTLIALKPFYLMALIVIMNSKPESV